jgi:AraC-like DNA-binding protein
MRQQLDELRSLAARAQNRPTETGIPRVFMVQGSIPEHELAAVYDPMVNLILRGGKTLAVGDQTLDYDPATYFVMSVDLPAAGTVRPAADGSPYLAVALTLDAGVLADLLSSLPNPADVPNGPRAFSVAAVTSELLDAWVRMLRLMDHPGDIPALAPAFASGGNVTSVAHEVGYESPTQFSREYGRAFGLPPAKDAMRIMAGFQQRGS